MRASSPLSGVDAERLDARRVEEARVEVADLALLGAGGRVGSRGFLEDRAHRLAAALVELVEGAPARGVARDLGVRLSQPPLTKRKRSSCGRTERSKLVVSMPSERGACATSGAADAASASAQATASEI